MLGFLPSRMFQEMSPGGPEIGGIEHTSLVNLDSTDSTLGLLTNSITQ